MRWVVYLDLVLILNFLVDFLLILAANRLSGFPTAFWRSVGGAGLGAVYGAACFLPGFSFLAGNLWRITALALMGAAAFGCSHSGLRRTGVFVLLSMALGGLAAGANRNDLWALGLCAGLLWLLCRISFRGHSAGQEYINVELTRGNTTLSVLALRDTGNLLRDPLTGEQVLVAGADMAEKLLGLNRDQLRHPAETLASGVVPGLRLIPYHSVGNPGGMLLAFRFRDGKIGKKPAQPLVAFAPEEIGKSGVYQMLTGGAV